MVSADKDTAATPFPSFEERWAVQDYTVLTPHAYRIRWTLEGPLATSVSVMKQSLVDPDDDEAPEPYYQGSTWHPFSNSPLTDPPISSIRVHVNPLDEWDEYWMDKHRDHGAGPLATVCCGTQRPVGKAVVGPVVTATARDFVTVHDFLSVVHPYLLDRRGDILAAMGEDPLRNCDGPMPAATKLMVDWSGASTVCVTDEAGGLKVRGRPTKMPASQRGATWEALQRLKAARGNP